MEWPAVMVSNTIDVMDCVAQWNHAGLKCELQTYAKPSYNTIPAQKVVSNNK